VREENEVEEKRGEKSMALEFDRSCGVWGVFLTFTKPLPLHLFVDGVEVL